MRLKNGVGQLQETPIDFRFMPEDIESSSSNSICFESSQELDFVDH